MSYLGNLKNDPIAKPSVQPAVILVYTWISYQCENILLYCYIAWCRWDIDETDCIKVPGNTEKHVIFVLLTDPKGITKTIMNTFQTLPFKKGKQMEETSRYIPVTSFYSKKKHVLKTCSVSSMKHVHVHLRLSQTQLYKRLISIFSLDIK